MTTTPLPPRHYPTPRAKCADLVVHLTGPAFALFGGGVLLGLSVARGDLGLVVVDVLTARREPRCEEGNLAGFQGGERDPGTGMGNHCVSTGDCCGQLVSRKAGVRVDAKARDIGGSGLPQNLHSGRYHGAEAFEQSPKAEAT